jgi:hypothetical protein
MGIKIILIVAALLFMYFTLFRVNAKSSSAWKKLLLIALFVAMVVVVASPSIVDDVARRVGVGRGADLLLYLLTLAFIASSINSYLKSQADKEQLHKLARRIAIIEAHRNNADKH